MVQGGNYSPLFEVGGKAFLGGNFKLSHHRFLTRFFFDSKNKQYMLYMCDWCARMRVRAARTHLSGALCGQTLCATSHQTIMDTEIKICTNWTYFFSFDFLLPIKIKFMSPILAFFNM